MVLLCCFMCNINLVSLENMLTLVLFSEKMILFNTNNRGGSRNSGEGVRFHTFTNIFSNFPMKMK